MNKIETKTIVDCVAAIDNRKITPEIIEVWHGIIGSLRFDVAEEALRLAQSDPQIKYLEPRHIVGWAKEAAFRLDRNQMPDDLKATESVPPPKCKHGTSLPLCLPCCRELANG